MAQFPCLPLWTDAWVADTCHLRGPIGRQKRCLYHDLLVLMWRTPGCRVPNDDAWLANHLFLTADEVRELLRPVVREFCQTDGNWIAQKRLSEEYVRVWQFKGRMSLLRKRHKNKNNGANTRRSTPGALYSTPTPTHNNLSSFGEIQWPTTTADTHPEPATQDQTQDTTTSPSPLPTADQPDPSKNTTADNPGPSTQTQHPTSPQQPTNSEPQWNGSQQPPETLAEINQRMGWSPAGTRKPHP